MRYTLIPMGSPGPVPFEVKETPSSVIVVTAPDGKKYEIRFAMMVLGVSDQGVTNPLDGLPIFNFASQIVTQTKLLPNG